MSIDWGLMMIACVLLTIAWSLNHFKEHMKFTLPGVKLLKGNVPGWLPGTGEMKGLYERWLIAVLVGLGSAVGTLSLFGALGVVWQWLNEGTNVFILIGFTLVVAIFSFFMVVRGVRHHPERTPAIAALLGISLTLTWGGWSAISPAAGRSWRDAMKISGTAVHGQAASGAADHPAAAGIGGEAGVVVLLIIVGIILIRLLRSYGRDRKALKGTGGGPGHRAVGGRGGRTALPLDS